MNKVPLYFIAERPAPAPHLARPEGRAALEQGGHVIERARSNPPCREREKERKRNRESEREGERERERERWREREAGVARKSGRLQPCLPVYHRRAHPLQRGCMARVVNSKELENSCQWYWMVCRTLLASNQSCNCHPTGVPGS